MLGFQYRMLRRQVFQPVLKAGKQAELINCKEKLELANVYRLEYGIGGPELLDTPIHKLKK